MRHVTEHLLLLVVLLILSQVSCMHTVDVLADRVQLRLPEAAKKHRCDQRQSS